MSGDGPSIVSVVTPFYNTRAYLVECIESVIEQSYTGFEYVLVDNHSTDGSREIAEAAARRDGRIRLVRPPTFLNQVQNYNFALSQISPGSRFCKIVQADDFIFKHCLDEMVALASSSPAIAMVGAYRLRGGKADGIGVPRTESVISGREACRYYLMGGVHMFGSPTTVLYRSDVVRARRPFYEEGRLHEDTEAAFEILRDGAFGVVHQVLTFSRVQDESITGSVRDFAPDALDYLLLVKRYGRQFLDGDEYAECLRNAETFYYGSIARSWLSHRRRGFWKYHADGLATSGEALNPLRFARHLGASLAEQALPPVLLRVLRKMAKAG